MSSITREIVLQMDLKSILAAVKDPTTSKDMQLLLRDRSVASRVSELMLEAQNREAEVDAQLARTVPPSTEELAAQAAAMAAAPPVVSAPAAAEVVTPPAAATANPFETEDTELKKIGITVVRDAKFAATRYIEDYHVRDEDGTPIGRATHLEARTLPELMAKKQEVHTQATRAFHRLKKQKLTFKQEPRTILSPEAIQEAARIALEAKDPGKVTDVIEQVIETKYSERELEVKKSEWRAQGRQIALEFQRNHLHDYNPCEANNKALGMYIQENNLEYNLESLEAAFIDLMDENKLVKVPSTFQRTVTEAANPASVAAVATPAQPEIPAAETVAAVTASATPAPPAAPSQPVAEATAPTPAAALNVQPAARRPGVSGGIVPGSFSAERPGAPDPALARKEFLKTVHDMKPEIMKHKLKTDPQFVKQLRAYGIKV